MNTNDPDPLEDLLAEWQPQVETPPGFRREVWRRIAAATDETGLMEHFAWWLLRPKREIAIVMTAVTLAVVWGLTHPPEALNPHDAYVMSISPFDSSHLSRGLP